MRTPVGPNGRQDLLQQSPPQTTPLSAAVELPQAWPAGEHVGELVAIARLQVPSVAPEAFVHRPPQQSRSLAHTSPFCRQNDGDAEQRPLTQ